MSTTTDTIAAIATPPGYGGVGIVRVSGPEVRVIARQVVNTALEARVATYTPFLNDQQNVIDEGIAILFTAPHSFTGEDVLELQGHGGPVVMDLLLKRVVELGARLAKPGEFSERAFLNDKLDLAQAEAIADLIESTSEQAARCAIRSLQGSFSDQIHILVEQVIQLRMFVEAAIDFPEEEVEFLDTEQIEKQMDTIDEQLESIMKSAQQGRLMREGIQLVIAGQPNVGKSSLLNSLAGRESAIVTSIAGTTRDVLREQVNLEGIPLHVIDTAGLRESTDPVEQEGILRAWKEIAQADLIVFLIDAEKGWQKEDEQLYEQLPDAVPSIMVHNKADLVEQTDNENLYISAKTGDGIQSLVERILQIIGHEPNQEGQFIARRRHLDALEKSMHAMKNAREQLLNAKQGELIAEELRLVQEHLSEITGEFTSDDLLGEIFSRFCIGK